MNSYAATHEANLDRKQTYGMSGWRCARATVWTLTQRREIRPRGHAVQRKKIVGHYIENFFTV